MESIERWNQNDGLDDLSNIRNPRMEGGKGEMWEGKGGMEGGKEGRAFDELTARLQEQMVRVGEDNLGPRVSQLLGRQSFNGCLCATKYESRGLDGPVGRAEEATARSCLAGRV